MKVVIDTNVFISSFLGRGSPRTVINLWRDGHLTICLSQKIIAEYVAVLLKLGLSEQEEIAEILDLFARGYHSVFTSRQLRLNIVENDPDDDKFFECAVALKADYLVSGDKQVLKVKDYCGIRVLSPTEFIKRL